MLESVFEQCAILSGLVTEPELVSSWEEMLTGIHPQPEEVPGRLADILVTHGVINRWQSQQLLAGRSRFTLGSYRIFDSIGHGGMGQVFKARHEVTGTVVAVKVLPREKATQSAIENFQNEVQVMASLSHPNLVRAIDAGMDGNVYYLAVEYVPGPDLRKLVRSRGPLSQESAASIIIQTARGLAHAHQAGMVHRDVKPGNILVTMSGIAKLSDLGLASSQSQEKSSKIVGTADYISPDQVRNPTKPNPIWDIYSLGCTLYYIVTGQVPYPKGTPSEKVKFHLNSNVYPVNPCLLNPLLSEEFVDVIACMMAKNPEERITSAIEVIQFLSPWSNGSPLPIQRIDADASLSESFQRSDNGEYLPVGLGRKTSNSSGIIPVDQQSGSARDTVVTDGVKRPIPPPIPPQYVNGTGNSNYSGSPQNFRPSLRLEEDSEAELSSDEGPDSHIGNIDRMINRVKTSLNIFKRKK